MNLYIPTYEVTQYAGTGVYENESILELKCCGSGEIEYVYENDPGWANESNRDHFWPNRVWKGIAFLDETGFTRLRNLISETSEFCIDDDLWDEIWLETAAKLKLPKGTE